MSPNVHNRNTLVTSYKNDISVTGHHDIMVRLITNLYSDGQYELRAIAIDADTKRLLPGARYKEMIVRDPLQLDKAKKTILHRVVETLPRARRGKSKPRNTTNELAQTRYDCAFQHLVDNNIQIYGWEISTRKQALSWFQRHFLPMLNEYCNDSDLTLITGPTLQRWESSEKEAIMGKKNRKSEITVGTTMARHMQQVAKIFEVMLQIDPSLPELDPFVFDTRRHRALELEQCKSIPEPIRQRFWRLIEAAVESEPRMAFCVIIYACGGTRTAEAAGTLPDDIALYDLFSVAAIMQQEAKQQRSNRLKTSNSYRLIPLPLWPTVLLRRCIHNMGPVSGDEPLVTAEELSAWVQHSLEECGLSEDYIHDLMQADSLFSDATGMISFEFITYLLRRDRISVLRNYCAYATTEADRFMGHKTVKLAQWAQEDLRLVESLRAMAYKAERYVFSTDPTLTLNPAFAPIGLSPGTDLKSPPFSRSRFRNNAQVPLLITLDVEAYEPGEEIYLHLPAKPTSVTLRSVPHEPHPRLLIGDNTRYFSKE